MENQGLILSGRYRLLEQIGKGGMGSVWRAEHVELGSPCAIKLIDEDLAESLAVRTRFRREAKAAAALISDHVVRTFDYGVDGGTPYIVMELLAGESLDQRIKRLGCVRPNELATILTHVARALDRAHERGLIHRDLKPGNLFICQSDTGEDCVKLLDFGIAKSLRQDDDLAVGPTRTGALVGSPAYMSPEQLRNSGQIDQTSDIWSLGVVAYEALVGKRPFNAATLADLTVSICVEPLPIPSASAPVPEGFDAWFAKACNRDRLARFANATELVAAFRQLLSSGAVTSLDVPVASPSDLTSEPRIVAEPATGARSGAVQASEDRLSTSHHRSTGPLSRTTDERMPRSSKRSYWLLGGIGLALAGMAWLRDRTAETALRPSPTSQVPAIANTPPAPEPSLPASLASDAASFGQAAAAPLPTPYIRQGPRIPLRTDPKILNPQRLSKSDGKHPASAQSAVPPKVVPDNVYGF